METVKGQEGTPIEAIIGLIFALLIAVLVILIILPVIVNTQEASSCVGFIRHIAALVANTTGIEIC